MGMGQRVVGKMEIDKNSTVKKFEKKKLLYFFRDVKQELKKVEWTSKDELKSYVKVVLISTFCFAMLIYGIDLFIQAALKVIGLLFG